MRKERVEMFLARRIGGSGGRRSGTMTLIARISVALSVAVMVVAISVIMGFKRELSRSLTGLDSHINISATMASERGQTPALTLNGDFEQQVLAMAHVTSITPIADHWGIVRSKSAMQGARLRGVTQSYDSLYFASKLTEGRLPRIGTPDRKKDILISASLAKELSIGVGDKLEYVFTSEEAPLRRDSYKVVGIYSSGLGHIEKGLTITDIRNVQRLYGWSGEQCSGYRIMVDDMDSVEEVASEIRAEAYIAGENELWRTLSIHNLYPQLFDWLATHDINGVVIIVIMLVVALLNMITALLIIIFERLRMIGTLKALGMRSGGVKRVFMLCGGRIILRGQLYGNLLAFALIAIQHHTKLIALNPEAYLVDAVPVAFGWGWWLALNVAIPVVLLALMTIPVAITSHIHPDQTLKYQ